jgi:hypothetical protein
VGDPRYHVRTTGFHVAARRYSKRAAHHESRRAQGVAAAGGPLESTVHSSGERVAPTRRTTPDMLPAGNDSSGSGSGTSVDLGCKCEQVCVEAARGSDAADWLSRAHSAPDCGPRRTRNSQPSWPTHPGCAKTNSSSESPHSMWYVTYQSARWIHVELWKRCGSSRWSGCR